MKEFSPIIFKDGQLSLLDQRKLPVEENFIHCNTLEDGFKAIKDMVVRGAPCIGYSAIFSLALWLKNNKYDSKEFKKACLFLKGARPTAVNLAFEVDKVYSLCENLHDCEDENIFYKEVVEFGFLQLRESESNNRAMARFAHEELKDRYKNKKLNILTHCNTGFLACGSIGTALGVIQYLGEQKLIENVWVDETRPYLQGSRLTAYELTKLEIPHKIVVEGAASHLMSSGLVDAIFVGADRIVSNGDTANKIGTASLSIIAKYYNIPFYVVAPKSSFDIDSNSGDEIEIELRPESEITNYRDNQISPLTSEAFNPSFDITSGINITGIICEQKCLKPPYLKSIKEIFNGN